VKNHKLGLNCAIVDIEVNSRNPQDAEIFSKNVSTSVVLQQLVDGMIEGLYAPFLSVSVTTRETFFKYGTVTFKNPQRYQGYTFR